MNEDLDISGRNLTDEQFYEIISKYPNLKILNCSCNKITSLDHLPANLQELNCRSNQITSLDHLPASLQKLDCDYNQITSLDHLPANLQKLDCRSNQITSLDHLPASLQVLYCNGNIISIELPNFSLYIKKSKYLRFLRNLLYARKTHAYLILRELRSSSEFYENCFPHEIIKHIVSFV